MANFIIEDIKKLFRKGNSLVPLITINVAVFLLMHLVGGLITVVFGIESSPIEPPVYLTWSFGFFGIPAGFSTLIWRIWTPITYMFMHANLSHILFNMLFLFLFGRIVESNLGSRRLIELYVSGGLVGAAVYLLIYNVAFLMGSELVSEQAVMVGASGSVLAVAIGAATLLPQLRINMLIFNVPLVYLALAVFIGSSIFELQINTGGKLAHIGGALWGYLYIRNLQQGKDMGSWVGQSIDYLSHLINPRPRPRLSPRSEPSVSPKPSRSAAPRPKPFEGNKQQQMDAILDKISQSGYDSLTPDEKDFLFRMSNRKNG